MLCQAHDPDADGLKHEWSSEGGKLIGTEPRITWISPETMGNYTVTVRVLDGKGGEAKETVFIRVLTNADGTTAPPIVLKMQLGAGEITSENRTTKVGTATKILCVIDNAQNRNVRYEWLTSGGSMKGTGLADGTCSAVFWTAPALTQEYRVTVVARDNQGNEALGTVLFDVFCCPRN
jgi:hypothetical protein